MLTAIGRWDPRTRGKGARAAIAVAALAGSIWLRHALEGILPAGFPYITFFPAVLLVTFFAGMWPGIAVAAGAGLVAWYLYLPPAYSFALNGANAVGLGFYVFIVATQIGLVTIMHRAIRDLNAERSLAATRAETRRLMFQELQHRISNNLAMLAGLLKMQRRTLSDPGAIRALEDSVARIMVVSRLQRLLHDPSAQTVNLGVFLHEMAREVLEGGDLTNRIAIEVEADRIIAGSDAAVPFGLIATELVSNALEHGFGGGGSGRIRVALAQDDGMDRGVLEVRDTGHGLPPGFSLEAADSLGLMLAKQFAAQLDGELTMESLPEGGTLSRLSFGYANPAGPKDAGLQRPYTALSAISRSSPG